MALDPKDVQAGIRKLSLAKDLLSSLDDFATSLLGKTAEALDLVNDAEGLLKGTHTLNDDGIVVEKEHHPDFKEAK